LATDNEFEEFDDLKVGDEEYDKCLYSDVRFENDVSTTSASSDKMQKQRLGTL